MKTSCMAAALIAATLGPPLAAGAQAAQAQDGIRISGKVLPPDAPMTKPPADRQRRIGELGCSHHGSATTVNTLTGAIGMSVRSGARTDIGSIVGAPSNQVVASRRGKPRL